jgi:hypothetical protein
MARRTKADDDRVNVFQFEYRAAATLPFITFCRWAPM